MTTRPDLVLVEEAIGALVRPTGLAAYDFDLAAMLPCRRPYTWPTQTEVIARVGAEPDYAAFYEAQAARGVRLVHSPDQHRLATQLPAWYPLLEDLTPESRWFASPPAPEAVADLGWPLFIKGERQTHKHRADLSVARDVEAFERIVARWSRDPVLHWQQMVCRRHLSLRGVAGSSGDKVRPSFEFRTFFWRGQLVGAGPYWAEFARYDWSAAERADGLAVAQIAADRLSLPFVVIDIAQDADGRWWVIECNDGQESGYAGVSAFALWQRVVALCKDSR